MLLFTAVSSAVPAATAHAADGEWRRVGLPFLWPNAGLGNISATGPSDVWAAGVQGAFCIPPIASWGCSLESDGNPVVRHWNGSGWEEFPLPGWTGNGPITELGTVASDDVWVSYAPNFVNDPPRYLAHFDGTAFTEIDPPETGASFEVHAGAAGAWLTTWRGVEPFYRWTGGGWQPAESTGLSRVLDVTARTAGDAWAVGQGAGGRAAAAHWDGRTWQPVEYPHGDTLLNQVLPVSANDILARAHNREDGTSRYVRWDGSTWSAFDTPDELVRILAVDASGTIWASGFETVMDGGQESRRPVVVSYAGGTWHTTPVPVPWGANDMTIGTMAVVPGTGALWLTASSSIGPIVLTNG